jgi:peptide/nickel transport system permease protein
MPSKKRGPESRLIKLLRGVKTAIGEIWRETPGKVGLFLLIFLVALAVLAAVSITPEFLREWESTSLWEDNPIVVPPCWINKLGFKTPQTAQIYIYTPSIVSTNATRKQANYTYTYTYTLDTNTPPQDIYIKVKAPLLCENETLRNPLLLISIERPDGLVVIPWRISLSIGNVTTCGALLPEQKTTKELFDLSGVVTSLMTHYNISLPLELIGENKTYQTYATAILRSAIKSELENRYMTILSLFVYPEYASITLNRDISDLEAIRKSILNLNDTISSLTNISETYKIRIINSLTLAYNNLTWLIENINTVTYTDYLNTLYNVSGELANAQKWATLAKLPADIRNTIGDVVGKVQKLIEAAIMTDKVVKPVLRFNTLQGDYRINVTLTYVIREAPESISAVVGIIVKGGCYGLLGTADKGIDLAKVILYGTPIALAIGLVTATTSVFIGVFAGIISGYYGGFIDEFIQRTVDILGNIPFLPVMIIIGSIAQTMFAGPMKSLYIILLYMVILIVFGWGGLAITVRAMTLSIKEEPYIEAARALGASNRRIIFKHIFPQVLMYATASLVFSVPNAILTEAGLSVLGIRHGWPTWGSVLASARAENRFDVWWWIFPPGIMISLTSLTFVLLGLAIERIVEPRLRTL